MPEARPNILVLMTDQHRWDAMGCAGNLVIRTPNLDALAASGVHFRNAVTPTPICIAARISTITGHRIGRTHWVANGHLPGPVQELPTLMSLLLRAGYWTQGVGKMHFSGRHYGFRDLMTMEECPTHRTDDHYLRYLHEHGVRTRYPQGIRDLLYFQPQTSGIPLEHSPNTWVAGRSVDFIREHVSHRKGQPFFLWSSWISPHPPFAPCEPYDTAYDPGGMPLPIYADRPIEDLPPTLYALRGRLDGAHRDPGRIRRIRALYYGLISHVDDAVGRILAELDAQGISDDTVVLFVSDHGEMMGDHGLSQKNCPYEPSVRIPCLLRWPGRTRSGRTCDDPVSLLDVLPTFIDELELPYPEEQGPLTGESLLGAAGGGLASDRDGLVIDYAAGGQRWVSLRSRTHMYATYAMGGTEELYDLQADPHEQHNIAGECPDLTAQFRDRVLAWEREHGVPGSLDGDGFRAFPGSGRVPTEETCRHVSLNSPAWPRRLPKDESGTVESFADAFTRAISKEARLTPDKLSLKQYREKVEQIGPGDPGGGSLEGTPWEGAW